MIPQIKKILFATDLSKNSAYAFYYAVHMAKRDEAKIVILHAIEPLPPMLITFGDFSHQVTKDRWEDTVKKFKERIQDISVKVDARMGISSVDLVSNILIRLGNPVQEILKAVDEEGCDVIVLGTHGKGFLNRHFLEVCPIQYYSEPGNQFFLCHCHLKISPTICFEQNN